MNMFHLSVSALNLICLMAAVVGAVAHLPHLPSALSFGVVIGYFANLLAVFVALVLLILLAIRTPTGKAKGLLKSSWLGLANGGAVVLAWVVFFAVGKLPA